jgi:hypothetical protein
MPIVFNSTSKRGDYNGYFTNSLNQQGVGVYGSTMANKFLQDAKVGLDSVDVVIVGDSNSGYNNSGWQYGWEKSMADNGMFPYATSLIPCMHSSATNIWAGQGIGVTYTTDQATPAAGSPAWLELGTGNATANAVVSTYWNNVSNEFRTWSVGLNWGYIAAGTGQQAGYYTQIGSASPLDPTANLKYRVGYLKFPSGSGQFSLNCYTPSPSALVTSTTVSTSGGNYELNIATLNVAANPTRTVDTRFTKYSAFYGAQYGVTGPVGFVFESVYRERKGFAVNMLQYYGGRQTGQMANTFDTAEGLATIKTYLKELRQRQIAAGGSGRVLVFTNTGINDANAAVINVYDLNANKLIGVFNNAWAQLGYPMSDLAFVVSVTHPTQADDANQAIGRSLGKSRVAFGSNGQVAFVDLNQIAPNSALVAGSFYDGAGNSHLTANGYAAVGNLLIPSLLK